MAYKAITVYTPSGSQPHIAAEDDAFIYDALLRGSSGILGALCCVKQDNNTVRLSGGGASNDGFILYVPKGEHCDLSIANGTQGLIRHDLIVARFTKGGGDTADSHVFAVITGTPGAMGADPSTVQSGLESLGDVNELALFRIALNGLEISSVTQLAPDAAALPEVSSVSSSCTGNAATATRLASARQISVSGDGSGSVSFDGSANAALALTVSSISGSRVYIQSTEPPSPQAGDLWLSWES